MSRSVPCRVRPLNPLLLICLFALGIVLAPIGAAATEREQTDIQLSKGSVILSNNDGTQLTMAPGSDLSLGRDDDGAPLLMLKAGEVYLSNVLQKGSEPLRVRMGDTVVEINRASVMVSRAGGAMDVTLLHGRKVTFSAGTPPLTKAGTRMRLGSGAPRVDRPSAGQMAVMKGAVGILSPIRPGRPAGKPLRPPKSPQARVPGQIQLRDLASTNRPPAGAPPPPVQPPIQPPPPPVGGGGLPNVPPLNIEDLLNAGKDLVN